MTQERLKSKVLWIAIGALLVIIMRNYGLYAYIGMDEDTFKLVLDSVLGILVMLGIINNPTDPNHL